MERKDLNAERQQVYRAEQAAIRKRREVQQKFCSQSQISSDNVESTAIGLTLSGGGVRSGAVSLGLLQALDERGVLPYVDYLSTVSGGGYAGAYLSSVALTQSNVGDTERKGTWSNKASGDSNGKPEARAINNGIADRARVDNRAAQELNGKSNGIAPANVESNGERAAVRRMLPISISKPGAQPPAMLDFIHGGHYLKRKWAFFNRHAIGMLEIWILVFSGLVAFASGIVWLFKWIDHPKSREFLGAMGFDTDLAAGLFPSLILFGLWCVCWSISYFRQRGKATGTTAQIVFFALILVTVVAIASLLGSGDLGAVSPVSGNDQPSNETLKSFAKTLQTVLFGAIAASLIPYLSPKKLLRSGTSPDSKPLERYLFKFASYALVFGIPFVLISFFARENISGWNDRRDDRVTKFEVKDWEELHPNWVAAPTLEEPPTSDLNGLKAQIADWFRNLKPLDRDVGQSSPWSYSVEWWNDDQLAWTVKDDEKLWTWPAQNPEAVREKQGERVRALFKKRAETALKLDALDSPPMDDSGTVNRAWQRQLGGTHLSQRSRWWYLAELIVQRPFASKEDYENNRLYRIYEARMDKRRIEEGIVTELTGNMSTPGFYLRFKPRSGWDSLRTHYKDDPERQAWVNRLETAYENAERVHARFGGDATYLGADRRIKLLVDRDEAELRSEDEHLLRTEEIQRALLTAHRDLVAVYYGDAIGSKATIYAANVLVPDQDYRLSWLFWSSIMFFGAAILISLNASSLHGYYAGQIANLFIVPKPGFGRKIPLSALETTDHGYPYHLINGSLQLMGRQSSTGRRITRDNFLFSSLKCGSDRLTYCDTKDFTHDSVTLADAVAISGGAFTPTETKNPLLMALLILGNMRLGQWVDNPVFCKSKWTALSRWLWVSPFRLLMNSFWRAERRPFCFVTDGGHHENLGIEPLLKRRCRLIIACDAGQDEQHNFLDFSKLLTRMRLEEGVIIRPIEETESTLKLESLVPEASKRFTKDHFVIAEIFYPEACERHESAQRSYLIYIKSSLTGDEPTDLVQYHRVNQSFPHDPTADQFYSPARFAAYSQLGYHVAEILCRRLPENTVGLSVDTFIRTISGEMERQGYCQLNTLIGRSGDEKKVSDTGQIPEEQEPIIVAQNWPLPKAADQVPAATVRKDIIDGTKVTIREKPANTSRKRIGSGPSLAKRRRVCQRLFGEMSRLPANIERQSFRA